jgi:hypothetical protein
MKAHMKQRMNPGDLVVIKKFMLVRQANSEEERYTNEMQIGIVVQLSNLFRELGWTGPWVDPTYLVLSSKEMKLYHVPAGSVVNPDDALTIMLSESARLTQE